MKIGDIVYLGEPKEWYKTPNNFNEMIIYPAGTPVKIIGDSGYRGWIQRVGCRVCRNWCENA